MKKGKGFLNDLIYWGVVGELAKKVSKVDSGEEHKFVSQYPENIRIDILFNVGNELRNYFKKNPIKSCNDYTDPHPCCC